MIEPFHISELIARKQRGSLNAEEQRELDLWLKEDPAHREIFERTMDRKHQLDKLKDYARFDQEKVRNRLEEELFGGKSVQLNTRKILRYAATIIFPLLVLGGAAWWFLRQSDADLIAEIDTHIHPGHEQAVLILSDGSSIELVPSRTVDRVEEGDATISLADQGIQYQTLSGEWMKKPTIYNKLITPRGGSYKLILADGSRVWLNAGSSLRFPVSFHDSIRQVHLEGEAYFEVRPDTKPFVVGTGDMHTRVLGTSFNISAYKDDAFIRTTLVEGKVKVTWKTKGIPDGKSVVLEPDQQAFLRQGEEILNVSSVDAGGYVSWVNGKMEFHRERLDQVMKRLARWYDFEYEFENEDAKDLSFSARLDRGSQISEILEMLAMTTDVSFEYDGKRVVVH